MGFIENQRRYPRAPVRCEGRVALREGGYWTSPTSNYGPRGCQLVAPHRLEPGMRIFVELVNESVKSPVELSGRVAWVAKEAPWRMGIAFDAGSAPAAGGFFEALVAAYPGIDTLGRAPERIPEDAPLAPAAPPDVVPLLTDEELRVMRALGAGLRADDLRARLGGVHVPLDALFALLGRGYVVIGDPDGAAADAWRRIFPAG